MDKYYAGIGSRSTPEPIQNLFTRVATYLEQQQYTLRSGHADGADMAFENGCSKLKEIYIPWPNFSNSDSKLVVENPKAFEIAEKFHPYWNNLSQGSRKLHARNTHQVLGLDLNTPVEFIICWTENGSGSGGTGQALRIAKHYGIPIFDAGKYNDFDDCRRNLYLFIKNYHLL